MIKCIDCVYCTQDEKLNCYCTERNVPIQDCENNNCEWFERNLWVSVDDRLPERKGAYLVYAPSYRKGSSSGLDNIGGIMFSRWNGKNWSIETGYYKRPGCVTHWMELPEKPIWRE